MNDLQLKWFLLLYVLLLSGILAHSVNRDIHLERQVTADLRNRVVGARLQKDQHADPYFYKWQVGEPYRYFDYSNKSKFRVSNITATPFFHDLLLPFCDLSQGTLSMAWLWLQYCLLFGITAAFFSLSNNYFRKWAVLGLSVLFTLTEAWKTLIIAGNIYLVIAACFAGMIYCLLRPAKLRSVIGAGFYAAVAILIRPSVLIVLSPFVLQYMQWRRFLIALSLFLLGYGLFVFVSPDEYRYWQSYSRSMKEQVKVHQGLDALPAVQEVFPKMARLEGIDFELAHRDSVNYPIPRYSENGNFFIITEKLFHRKIPVFYLTALFGLSVLLFIAGFLYFRRKNGVTLYNNIAAAFVLYFLSEFFSPVYRQQYNTVQWLPLLLMLLLGSRKKFTAPVSLVVAGLIMNIFSPDAIPMVHTIGEVCWLIALVLTAFAKPTAQTE